VHTLCSKGADGLWTLDTVGETRDWKSVADILSDYKKTMSTPVSR
jgi:hypothetical protein